MQRSFQVSSPLKHFLEGKIVCFKISSLSSSSRDKLEQILLPFFRSCNLEDHACELFFCIHELVSNAFKANIKRHFFTANNFNIDDPEEYRLGMKAFREFLYSSPLLPSQILDDSSYQVKVQIQRLPGKILLEVINTATLHYYERLRMLEKESESKKIKRITDVMLDSHDCEEGKGLGLLFVFFILHNKLSGSMFSLHTEPQLTKVRLTLPC
ncbi:MAG: hypothetical protein SNJ78_01830 [Spirochaetales bacterium]